jgi:hypothetical protein
MVKDDLLLQSYNEYGVIQKKKEAYFKFNDEEEVKFADITEGKPLVIELSSNNSEIMFTDKSGNTFKIWIK